MISEVARQIKQYDKELNALPPLVTHDPLLFMIDLVTKLCFEVKERVRGCTTHTALVQNNNAVYQELNLAIVVPEHTDMLQYLEDVKAHIGS